uniref:Anaphase-promoting complex subunit 4 WD40 domain-containing protein n=1 Tax=Propithecus coquereli TaxID=379532 RepID=A0A2K6F6Q8_PROCO
LRSFPPRLNEKEIVRSWTIGKLLLNLVDHTEVVRDLTFTPDGSLILISASRDKTLNDGNMMKVLRGHQNWVYSCAFSPDSSMLCSVGARKAVSFAAILAHGALKHSCETELEV